MRRIRTFVFLILLTLVSITSSHATLGYDANYDGVWDDVATNIATLVSPAQNDYAHFMQLAKAMQDFMDFGVDPSQTLIYSAPLVRAWECIFYVHPFDDDLLHSVWAAVMATPARHYSWEVAAANASSLRAPGPQEDATQWYRSCHLSVQQKPDWPPIEQLMLRDQATPWAPPR